MADILECHPATTIGSTYTTTNKLVTNKGVTRTGDEILNDTATIDNTEDTYFRRTDIHDVVNHMILTVECSHITAFVAADGYKILAIHIDIGSEDGIGVVFSTIHDIGKLN